MALCKVTGTLYLPDGQRADDYSITLHRKNKRVVADYLGTVIPQQVRALTSSTGTVDFDILTGEYEGYAQPSNAPSKSYGYSFNFVVPEAATANFADCIDAVIPVDPPPYWYQQTIQARDEAVAAAATVAGMQSDIDQAVLDSATALTKANSAYDAAVPLASYASVLAAPKPADRNRISAIIGGDLYEWVRVSGGPNLGGGWAPAEAAYPEHFGAKGDGTTDDTAACQAWADYIRVNGKEGRVRGKTYSVTSLQLMPSQYYSIAGDNFHLSNFLIRNTSRTAIGLNFGAPDGNTRIVPGVRIQDIRVQAASGTKACLMQFARNSDIQANRIKVSGFHGATGIRAYGLWNCDFKEVTVYGCGHNIPMKQVPNGATFSIANNATTLTCSVDLFDSTDVGRNITLTRNDNQAGQRHTISSVTDARTVTVSEVSYGTHVNSFGNYGGAKGLVTAGGNTLTMGVGQITQDDVGRSVYILSGMENPSATGGYIPLRAVITSVSANVATLDRVTPRSVNWTELVFDPAVDMGDPWPDALNQKTNDATMADLHVELHRGCGIVLNATRFSAPQIKLHGVNVTAVVGNNEQATNIQALMYGTDGIIYGHFDQSVSSNIGRIVMQDMLGINFPLIQTHSIYRTPNLYTVGKLTAPTYRSRVDIGTIQFYGNTSDPGFKGVIGLGWYNQYGTTSCSARPGVALQHGNPDFILSP